jgi:hypothetical protein
MKLEGGFQQEVVKKPSKDFDGGFDIDNYPSDEVTHSTPVEDLDAEESDVQEVERQRVIADRLEARVFSKEHSQFYRDRLAWKIWEARKGLILQQENDEQRIEKINATKEQDLQSRRGQIQGLEAKNQERQLYVERVEALKQEVAELEQSIEDNKNSFLGRLFGKEKIARLEKQKTQLIEDTDYDRKVEGLEYSLGEIERLSAEIAKLKSWLEVEEQSAGTEDRIAEIRQKSFFAQDKLVTNSKSWIKDFYEKNLDLKKELDEDPKARDVAENCRELGVLLRHGVPIPNPGALDTFTPGSTENNSVIDSTQLDSSDRIRLALSLQPAIATHTGSGWPQGLLLGGGEITSAGKSDLFTYASGLDSRNPKYEPGQVSSLMPDIKERFKDAVENQGKIGNKRFHNEVDVLKPIFSAIYTIDSGDRYGRYNEFDGKDYFETPETRWALEQSMITGLPAVVILESGKMINIATDEEVTIEQLLDRPVEHSIEERLEMFDETIQSNVKENSVATEEELSERFEYFDAVEKNDQAMEQYKQLNRELAEAKLHLWESERRERQRIYEEEGLDGVRQLADARMTRLDNSNQEM